MKHSRSPLYGMICLLLIATLTACGGGDGDDDSGSSSGGSNNNGGSGSTSSQVDVTARAGDDRDVVTGTRVTLDGTGSRVEGDRQLRYRWTLVSRPSGSNASLADANAARPSFTADVAGNYTAELTASAGDASDTDRVTIKATSGNTQPTADAGTDRNVETGTRVTLDGSGSRDADGDDLSYRWTFVSRPNGSDASLSDANNTNPSFTPDVAGTYTVKLTVRDDSDASDSDQVTITAAVGNSAPTANAGADRSIQAGQAVRLDGSRSTDADGDSLSYTWRIVSQPDGSAAALASPNSVDPSLTTDLAGNYVVELAVSDGQASDTDRVVVDAGAALIFRVDQSNGQDQPADYKEAPNQAAVQYTIKDTAGRGVPDGFVVRRLELSAIGQSYTIQNVRTSLTSSSNDIQPMLRFNGLSSGMTISTGDTLDFSNSISGVTTSGRYIFSAQFDIAETGEAYRVRYIITVK